MGSLYASYVKDRLGDEIIESDRGFVTYRYLNNGKTVYIVDIFVLEGHRCLYAATCMANEVCDIAKARGATELIGTVNPNAKNVTINLKVLLGYGMEFQSASQEMIVFRKEI